MQVGRRLEDLGTEAFPWTDLLSLVSWAQPDTATYKALNPRWQQTTETDLLRSVDHAIRTVAWAVATRRRKEDIPKPVQWQWEIEEERLKNAIRGDRYTQEQMAELLGWTRGMIEARAVPDDTHRAFPDDEE